MLQVHCVIALMLVTDVEMFSGNILLGQELHVWQLMFTCTLQLACWTAQQ